MSPGFVIGFGVIFGLLAALCAYVIALHEYRQRMLRVDQSAPALALRTAVVTFAFTLVAAIALGWFFGARSA